MDTDPRPDPSCDPDLLPLIEDWRRRGRDLVAAQRCEFDALLAATGPEIRRGRFASAAAMAQTAANHAVLWHPGAFASPVLDGLIAELGAKAIPSAEPRLPAPDGRLRVLHVATQVGGIGGHVRMLWRWIGEDRDGRHSVALTRQTTPLPQPLLAAVAASGGTVHHPNRAIGGPLAWARNLQGIMAATDLVVLHVHNQDIVPFLAMCGLRDRPPVLLLNHADHVFWVGAGLVDAVVSTRLSGHALCASRRGIPTDRNLTLPLCLPAPPRVQDRAAARRSLGLAPEATVLLTIARAVKFRALGDQSFADMLVPVLRGDPRLHLIVIGPGGTVDWSAAQAQVPGQITVHAERTDTAAFLEAADIYVDSFPFPSVTSLLEAGLHGLPLVTRTPYGAGCEVMGADSIGIDGVLVRARTAEEVQSALLPLVTDPVRRAALGAGTRAAIEQTNMGPGWRQDLSQLYGTALALPRRTPAPSATDAPPRFEDVDLLIPFIFGTVLARPSARSRLNRAQEIGFKTMPLARRIAVWSGMALRGEFAFRPSTSAWSYLVPEWMTVRLRVPVS